MNLMAFDPYTLRQMIKEHGLMLTLRKKTFGSYNTTSGTTSYTDLDYAVRGYFYDYTPEMIDGNSVIRGDRRLVLDSSLVSSSQITTQFDEIITAETLAALGIETFLPAVSDQIIGLGDTVNIVKVMEIKSGSRTMCYLLQVRE